MINLLLPRKGLEGVFSRLFSFIPVFLNKLNETAINLDLERGEQIELG